MLVRSLIVHMYHIVGDLWPVAAFLASHYAFPPGSAFSPMVSTVRGLLIDTEYSLIP